MRALRLCLGTLGLALGWAMVADAGSMIRLVESNSAGAYVLARDGQSWAGFNPSTREPERYREGVATSIATPAGATWDALTGISDDGNVVTGQLYQDQFYAIRWENGVLERLLGPGDTSSFTGSGNSVSPDGRTVVGYAAQNWGNPFPAYWRDGVRTYLPVPDNCALGFAEAISADGRTIVGKIVTGDGALPAVWRDGTLSLLPILPNNHFSSSALEVNFDGSVIVGTVYSHPNTYIVRWVDGELQRLSYPVGFPVRNSFDVSDDGSIVSCIAGIGMVWRDGFGSKPFDLYIERHYGLSLQDVLPNYTGLGDLEMTPDGRYFSGLIYDEFFNPNSFIAYLDPSEFVVPEPSSLALVGCAAVGLLWAGRRARSPRG
jgi:hypothetical protein